MDASPRVARFAAMTHTPCARHELAPPVPHAYIGARGQWLAWSPQADAFVITVPERPLPGTAFLFESQEDDGRIAAFQPQPCPR